MADKPPTVLAKIVTPPRMPNLLSALQHCASLAPGHGLLLSREPHNPVDSNAVMSHAECGHEAGYLDRDSAALIAPWIDQGWVFTGTVVTEGSFVNQGFRIGIVAWPEARIVPIQRIGATTRVTKRERLDA